MKYSKDMLWNVEFSQSSCSRDGRGWMWSASCCFTVINGQPINYPNSTYQDAIADWNEFVKTFDIRVCK
jgi:hypothetical protein